jgi:hypothetical protein
MFRFCKREKPLTKTRITLIEIIILINKELSTFILTVTSCIWQVPPWKYQNTYTTLYLTLHRDRPRKQVFIIQQLRSRRPAPSTAAGLGTPTMVFSIYASKPATDIIHGVPTGDDSDMVSKKKVSSIQRKQC